MRRWRKTSASRRAVVAKGLGKKNLRRSGSCPRVAGMTSLHKAGPKGGALGEPESASTKGCLLARGVVVAHSVCFLTKFSFGLLAKQKQKVVSSTSVPVLFHLILLHNSQDLDLFDERSEGLFSSSRQNTFPHTM